MPCAGPLLERLLNRQLETWNDILDRKRLGGAVNARGHTRSIFRDRLGRGIHHPHDEHSRAEVIANFAVNFRLSIVLTTDLDGKMWNSFEVAFRGVPEREAEAGQKGSIRRNDAIRIPPQDNSN